MNKKLPLYLSVLIIFLFIGYIIYDSVKPEKTEKEVQQAAAVPAPEDAWKVSGEYSFDKPLKAVAVSQTGLIYAGGDSYVTCFDNDFSQIWKFDAPAPVTAIACLGDSVYASTIDQVLVINNKGKLLNEWGPYEANSIITSVSAGRSFIGIADAGNNLVFLLDKGGEVKKIIGQDTAKFILPSAYFDLAVADEKTFYVANTGHRRIETRNLEGRIQKWFGEAGLAPGAFCGCCNPAHFTIIPNGFITAEKGINRIKILDKEGKFVEFVSSKNTFAPAIPLDVASADGKTIYAANPADSKIYVFTRK
jgi:DNA-binding beta-propeller fold protein YncE